jgi:predicted amidophosphoribosyltransferase
LNLRANQQCGVCASGRGPAHLTSLRAATVCVGAIRSGILAYKFRGVRRLTEPAAEPLAEPLAEPPAELQAEAYRREDLAADLVTPVPAHPTRRRQRGYDQLRPLARETVWGSRLPVLRNAVIQARATAPQTHLQCDQRVTNHALAFALSDTTAVERSEGWRIQLVDDKSATGGALDATAAALAVTRPTAIYGLAHSCPNGPSFS